MSLKVIISQTGVIILNLGNGANSGFTESQNGASSGFTEPQNGASSGFTANGASSGFTSSHGANSGFKE